MIYVDELQERRVFGHIYWCHLLADSIRELHEFAEAIGLKVKWYQAGSCPHYDITAGKRGMAVKHGAKEVRGDELLKVIKKWHGWKKRGKG